MTRVNIVVEGPTEEGFVNEVLAPACWPHGVYLMARIVGEPGHKRGWITHDRVEKDVILLLKQERATYCTTLLDYYGLKGNWPGMPVPDHYATSIKAARLEKPLWQGIVAKIGDEFRPRTRFRPYFQMHEFEGLLFSDPAALARGLDRPDLQGQFTHIRELFNCPEDINDGQHTAPSKRIIQNHEPYDREKPLLATLAALSVGLRAMRAQCPRFNAWVTWIQGLR